MTIDQISVFVENKSGAMSQITAVLSQAGINMRALSIAETKDFGVMRLIANDTDLALSVLKKAEYVTRVTPVLAVSIEDRPGGLHEIMTALAEKDINIEYLYAFVARSNNHIAYVVLRVEDNDMAAAALSAKGIKMLNSDDIQNL